MMRAFGHSIQANLEIHQSQHHRGPLYWCGCIWEPGDEDQCHQDDKKGYQLHQGPEKERTLKQIQTVV